MIKNVWQKPRNKCAEITRYQNIYLISARLLRCRHTLPLHGVALDDVDRPWRREKIYHTLVQNLTLTL